MKILKNLVYHRRRTWIIGAGIVAVLLLVAYTGYSLSSWRTLDKQTSDWQQSTRRLLDTMGSAKAGTAAEKTASIERLRAVTTEIEKSRARLCDVPGLISWQTAAESAKRTLRDCQKVARSGELLKLSLEKLGKYLESEAAVARILESPGLLTDTADEKTWEATSNEWNGAAIAIKALKVDMVFKVTQAAALSAVNELDSAWQELLVAHKAQNKTQFTSAKGRVEKAYAGLVALNDTNDHEFQLLITEANTRYTAALSS